MDTQSLLSYLQTAPQPIPHAPTPHAPFLPDLPSPRGSTLYSHHDVPPSAVGVWADFHLAAVLQRFEPLLRKVHLPANPYADSPPQEVYGAEAVRLRVGEYIMPRVRRALRRTFNHLDDATTDAVHAADATDGDGERRGGRAYTRICWQFGAAADGSRELIFGDETADPADRHNRLPGRIKMSTSWARNMSSAEQPSRNRWKFSRGLAQVRYAAYCYGARYGYILTDRELVAFKRVRLGEGRGRGRERLLLAEPVAWSEKGSGEEVRMTVLLGLWYLGMLAAEDGWEMGE